MLSAVFGGYVADRVIGYQRSILLGAVFMAVGLFAISFPDKDIFKLGLATIIVGNGMFKPNISTMVGKLYALNDTRRDSGFTIFYMGINLGAFMAPILTQYLAQKIFNTGDTPAYKIVFFAAGIGMLISLVWFYFGRATLKGIGAPEGEAKDPKRVIMVAVGALFVIPVMYLLLKAGAFNLQIVLMVLFAGPGSDADDRRYQGRHDCTRQDHRHDDHLRLQHPVLGLLRTGRQLVHLPG
ncbi:MFS transporter [Massilia sp. B-10]|nr:MFS transporter [Massilia sp. B-10]